MRINSQAGWAPPAKRVRRAALPAPLLPRPLSLLTVFAHVQTRNFADLANATAGRAASTAAESSSFPSVGIPPAFVGGAQRETPALPDLSSPRRRPRF